MSSRTDNTETLVFIMMAVLAVIGYAIYVQLQAMAHILDVDTETAVGIAWRCLAILVITAYSALKGHFRTLYPYLPLLAFLAAVPMLRYWAWNYILPGVPLNHEPQWFGATWVQTLIGLVLLGCGYAYSRARDN